MNNANIQKSQTLKLPPEPKQGPFSALRQSLSFRHDPIAFLTLLSQTYGDICQTKLLMWPVVLLNHPDYVRQVLVEHNQSYNKDNPLFNVIRLFVGNGLLTADEELWTQQHRLLRPVFHKLSRNSFGSVIVDETVKLCEHWNTIEKKQQSIDIAQEMGRLTLHIVGQTIFKISANEQVETIGAEFGNILNFLGKYFQLPFPPLSFPTKRNRHVKEALRRLDSAVYDLIDQRRASGAFGNDMLGLLLSAKDEDSGKGMSNQQIRDEIVTFFVTANDSTKHGLAWTWYLLSQNPEVKERLHEEIDRVLAGRLPTIDDLPQLAYTRMIIDETLRLYPLGWLIMRKSIEDGYIGDYHLPKHTNVMWSPYLLHRHPDFWDKPECFQPERFRPDQKESYASAAYIPFGSGPHTCIGKHVALMEMTLILATIAQRYHLVLTPGHLVQPEALITLQLRNGLPMKLHRRSK